MPKVTDISYHLLKEGANMSDVKIGRIVLGMYGTNCYFVYKEGSDGAVLIDPADSGDKLVSKLSDNGLKVVAILLTHGHFDHIYGVKKAARDSGAKVYAYTDEAKLLSDVKLNCSLSVGRGETIEPDEFLTDNEVLSFAGIDFKVLHTPGHTAGSCCFYIEEAKILVSGDTLFCESVGRSDLPTGSMGTLVRSINDKLMVLPDDVKVYPGHGGTTTIGFERENNPFL